VLRTGGMTCVSFYETFMHASLRSITCVCVCLSLSFSLSLSLHYVMVAELGVCKRWCVLDCY